MIQPCSSITRKISTFQAEIICSRGKSIGDPLSTEHHTFTLTWECQINLPDASEPTSSRMTLQAYDRTGGPELPHRLGCCLRSAPFNLPTSGGTQRGTLVLGTCIGFSYVDSNLSKIKINSQADEDPHTFFQITPPPTPPVCRFEAPRENYGRVYPPNPAPVFLRHKKTLDLFLVLGPKKFKLALAILGTFCRPVGQVPFR